MKRPILLTTTVLGLATTAFGAEIRVPADASSVQAAVNMAVDGDVIAISPGTYHEAVNLLGKAVTLQGDVLDPDSTVIDATGHSASAVLANSGEWNDTIVEGLTLTGGSGTSIGGYTYGGGMYARYSSPTIRACVFRGNTADAGGGLAVHGSTLTVTKCRFDANTATEGGYFGGGGFFSNGGAPKLLNCEFTDNTGAVLAKGGAISLFLGFPEITNCLITGNHALYGGAIMNQKSSPRITNCTVANNTAVMLGGGMDNFDDSAFTEVTNTIFWNNSSESGYGHEIIDQSGAVTIVRFSNVMGGWTGSGEGNIDEDPMFADPTGEDCRLTAGSPCIDPEDGSDSDALPEDVTTDLDDLPRIMNGLIDMGAFEFQDDNGGGETACADLDANGVVEFDDLVEMLGYWGTCDGCAADLDGDGFVDLNDLFALLTAWGGGC